MTGLPRFFGIWQGHLTPPNRCSSQGIRASHYGKGYKGNAHGRRVSQCLSR
jgi:hypothetical protein